MWAIQEAATRLYEIARASENAADQRAATQRLLDNANTPEERAIVMADQRGGKVKALQDEASDQTRECADTVMPAKEAGDIRDAINVVAGD